MLLRRSLSLSSDKAVTVLLYTLYPVGVLPITEAPVFPPPLGEGSGGESESHQLGCSSESDGDMLSRPEKGKKPEFVEWWLMGIWV